MRPADRGGHLQAKRGAEFVGDAEPSREGLSPTINALPTDVQGGDHPAGTIGSLQHHHALPRHGQAMSGRQAGDPSPDDDGGHSSCTSATRSVSTAGSVSGGTPWPRFTMWAGAARPR